MSKSRSEALLADVHWPDGALRALRAARDAGIPAILDGEIASVETLEALTGAADHVIFSERGLQAYAGHDSHGGLRRVLKNGALVAAMTLGEKGVLWVESAAPSEVLRCPAFAVDTVDTLAAGDVFHGAYALALAEGQRTGDSLRCRRGRDQVQPARRKEWCAFPRRGGRVSGNPPLKPAR